ncbi:MAG: hypothetical protein J6C38_00100 [Oscillospiraceae bacterium]|nr:hypothetical protein [Oscillospiraceae bacterium]
MDNEAIINYKFYLCKIFLDKILAEKLITKSQRASLENAVIKRLSGL